LNKLRKQELLAILKVKYKAAPKKDRRKTGVFRARLFSLRCNVACILFIADFSSLPRFWRVASLYQHDDRVDDRVGFIHTSSSHRQILQQFELPIRLLGVSSRDSIPTIDQSERQHLVEVHGLYAF